MATFTTLSMVGKVRPDGQDTGTRKIGCKNKDRERPFSKCLENQRNGASQTETKQKAEQKKTAELAEGLSLPGFVMMASALTDRSPDNLQPMSLVQGDNASRLIPGAWSLLPVGDGASAPDPLSVIAGTQATPAGLNESGAGSPALMPGNEELPPDFIRFLKNLINEETGETSVEAPGKNQETLKFTAPVGGTLPEKAISGADLNPGIEVKTRCSSCERSCQGKDSGSPQGRG